MKFTRIKNFINSEWMEEKDVEYVPLYNPSTGAVIGEVPLSTPETSADAVASAAAAYDGWRKLSVDKRISYLYAIRQAMADNAEELAFSIAVDQAKHISEARGEVQRVIQIIESANCIPAVLQGETLDNIAGNINGRVIREPLGVFCGVAPFNFPALVFGWFIPYAIGTGNTFVFKPSTQSPYFMQKMGDIFNQVGLPKGVVNIIHGNRTVVQPWYEDPNVSGICLVGSTPTAKKMAEAAGRGGKRSMLLGGAKNFLVAMEDVEWDVFIENFLNSCYGSAGQRCLAGSIVAAVPEIHAELIERIVAVSKDVKYGSALDPEIYMGPVISFKAKASIENYIETGVQEGANLILDGRNPDLPEEICDGYYVGPTVFTGVKPDMTIYKEEIFGPVVSIVKVGCINTALDLIRKQAFGNGACIFTQNLGYTEHFIKEANVGMVGVNVGIPAPHPYLPFGGIKDSHLGTNKVQGKDGIDFFTQNKIATIRYTAPGVDTNVDAKDDAIRSCVAR